MTSETEGLIQQDRGFIAQTSIDKFLRERVIAGECRILNSEQHVNLRDEIATQFSIHSNEVIVVGSAKLGYSVSPSKALKPFNDSSDIDVAIVSAKLFEEYWLEMYRAKKRMIEWPELPDARKYLFSGWIRPDKLPMLQLRNDWFDFFSDLQSRRLGGPYPVRAGIYYNIRFLEAYQENGVRRTFSGVE